MQLRKAQKLKKNGKAGGRDTAKLVRIEEMKGSGSLVATVLAASTVVLTSSSSTGVKHVSFSPISFNQESQNGASRNCTASERGKFAPQFDGLRFIETLVTAHR